MATTTLKTEVLLREFYFNGVRIPDPAPAMSVEEVREFAPMSASFHACSNRYARSSLTSKWWNLRTVPSLLFS